MRASGNVYCSEILKSDRYTISEEIIEKLAQMKPAASDFRVIWDNAYICHDFDINDGDPIYNIFDYAKKYGTEDLFIEFTSTSKITLPVPVFRYCGK